MINRRYEEGIKYYRMAFQLADPTLWSARSQLGVNLMRLGFGDEAKQQLEHSYQARYRDAETVNSLRLLDTLKDYEAVNTGPATLILHKKEAALLRPISGRSRGSCHYDVPAKVQDEITGSGTSRSLPEP